MLIHLSHHKWCKWPGFFLARGGKVERIYLCKTLILHSLWARRRGADAEHGVNSKWTLVRRRTPKSPSARNRGHQSRRRKTPKEDTEDNEIAFRPETKPTRAFRPETDCTRAFRPYTKLAPVETQYEAVLVMVRKLDSEMSEIRTVCKRLR